MYLPKPPSIEQKLLYLDSGRNKIYSVSFLSTAILITGMVFFVKTNPLFIPYTVFSIFTILYLFCSYFIGVSGSGFDYKLHTKIMWKWLDRSSNTEIDVLLPVCGEPIEIIENTWQGVKDLRFAHEGILKVYVLDDSRSETIKALAEKYKFNYITRPDNTLKKAGNLRYAFTKTSAPYFIVFDADFIPRQDFILSMMPYFFEDNKVGIVQSPQFFEVAEGQTLIQKGAGAIQELFYRLIQVNRDSFNGSICVGSNAIYSRSHLEKFGGTAAIGYSEDVRTAYRLSKAGEKVKYIPLNLAMGTCPENWKQFFTQYYRWSMGSIDLLLSKEFWEKGLTKMQRICYLSGMMYYLTTGLSVLFAALPSIYLLIFKPEYIYWYNLAFSLPSLLFGLFYMKYWSKHPYNINVLRVRHVSFFAHLFAFKDLLFNTKEAWVPTGAVVKSSRYDSFCVMYIFISLFIPIITTILIGVRLYEGHSPFNYLLLIFFTAYNAYIALPVIDEL